jgi:hypothetical protein
MHTGTGEIKNFTEKEILEVPVKERENWVKLTDEQYETLMGMNRLMRRSYYKKHRKEFNGLSWSEVNEQARKS